MPPTKRRTPTKKPRQRKTYANLADMIRAMPSPTEVSDDQLRRFALQLILDYPDQTDHRLMRTKLDTLRLLYEMNHVKEADKDDGLTQALLAATKNG